MPSSSPSGNARSMLRFHLLITRLVYQDAARQLGFAVGLIVMLQVFVVRYIPPWEIRAVIQGASDTSRGVFLVLVLFGYGWLTRPIVRILVGSERLRFFRHLPVSPRSWSGIHLRHLWMVNLLWYGLAGYGLWTGPGRPPLAEGLLWWLMWAQLICAIQVAFLFFPPRPSHPMALLAWLLSLPAAYGLFLARPMWAALLVLIGASALLARWLQAPAPLPEARTWRLLPSLRGPQLALLRLDLLTLLRQASQSLWLGLVAQIFFAAILALVVRNNQMTTAASVPLLLRVAAPLLLVASLFGASVALQAMRLQQPSQSWSQHLPLSAAMRWRSRVLLGALGTLPAAPLLCAGIILGGGPAHLGLMAALVGLGLLLAPWSGLLITYVGLNAQRTDHLDESQFFPIVVQLFAPLLLISWFPWAGPLLVAWAIWFGLRGLRLQDKLLADQRRMPPQPKDHHTL